jgi:hypothetical protein
MSAAPNLPTSEAFKYEKKIPLTAFLKIVFLSFPKSCTKLGFLCVL